MLFNIRVTHKSIGQTNEQWDLNRQEFSNKYQDQLPIKIKKTKEDKLKVLLSCLNFKEIKDMSMEQHSMASEITFHHHVPGPENVKKIWRTFWLLLGITIIELGMGFGIYFIHKNHYHLPQKLNSLMNLV